VTGSATGGGRNRITARALERVTAAVAAEAFGSPRGRVKVELTDHDGALDVGIETVIRSVTLTRAAEEPRAVARLGGSILDRSRHAEDTVRSRVQDLTGFRVRRVAVHITGVHLQQERRVR
jgi:uncharacterized alkaline shock family protein YloU